MKAFSLFLLVAGWFLVVSAIALLRQVFMQAFVLAGFAVELLGLLLLARANLSPAVSAIPRSLGSSRPEYRH